MRALPGASGHCPGAREMGPLGPKGPQREEAVGGDFYCLGWRLYGVIFIGMGWFLLVWRGVMVWGRVYGVV